MEMLKELIYCLNNKSNKKVKGIREHAKKKYNSYTYLSKPFDNLYVLAS